MTRSERQLPSWTFEDAEGEHLRIGIGLSTEAKIAFFEAMIELAWQSGALTPERLALRDREDGGTR